MRAPAQVTGGAALLLGILASAAEYSHRTILTTRLVQPNPVRVLAAKIIAMAAVGAALGATAEAVAAGVGAIGLAANGVDLEPLGHGIPGITATVILLVTGYAVLGTAIGTLLRNTTAAVGVTLIWVFAIENVLPVVTGNPSLADWMPGNAAQQILTPRQPARPRSRNRPPARHHRDPDHPGAHSRRATRPVGRTDHVRGSVDHLPAGVQGVGKDGPRPTPRERSPDLPPSRAEPRRASEDCRPSSLDRRTPSAVHPKRGPGLASPGHRLRHSAAYRPGRGGASFRRESCNSRPDHRRATCGRSGCSCATVKRALASHVCEAKTTGCRDSPGPRACCCLRRRWQRRCRLRIERERSGRCAP